MLMSKREWVNRLTLFLGYFPAGPSLCWYYRHVISHHPHTNTHDDVDVRYIHLIDKLPECLSYLKIVSLPGIFIGAVAELSVVQSLEMIVMRCVESNPVYLWTSLGGWSGVGSIIPEAIIWAAFHGWFGPSLWCYMCMWLTAGAVFVPMSQLAHVIIYPDPNLGSNSWAADQIIACVNFAPRSSYAPFSGMNKLRHSLWYHMAFGLTTQIDHHLFPSIAARCYDDIHEQVIRPVCAKYNVPLYEVSGMTALGALWQRLLTGQASTALLDDKKSD
jgi:fatty acid desaturase